MITDLYESGKEHLKALLKDVLTVLSRSQTIAMFSTEPVVVDSIAEAIVGKCILVL